MTFIDTVDLSAPLPLGYVGARRRALELRERNLSYPAIAIVIAEYHGFERSAYWWSHELRKIGAEARPRGNSYCSPDRIRVAA